jgi:hypothetical protein
MMDSEREHTPVNLNDPRTIRIDNSHHVVDMGDLFILQDDGVLSEYLNTLRQRVGTSNERSHSE